MATSFTARTIRSLGADADRKARYGRKPGEGRTKFAAGTVSANAALTCDGNVIRAADRSEA